MDTNYQTGTNQPQTRRAMYMTYVKTIRKNPPDLYSRSHHPDIFCTLLVYQSRSTKPATPYSYPFTVGIVLGHSHRTLARQITPRSNRYIGLERLFPTSTSIRNSLWERVVRTLSEAGIGFLER